MTRGKIAFSDEVAKEIRKKYENGATLRTLVDEYGTNPNTIRNTIHRIGGTTRTPNAAAQPAVPRSEWPKLVERYNNGELITSIAADYNATTHNIQYYLDQSGTRKRKKPVREGSILSKAAELREQYEEDPRVTVYTLAERYNCSISAIHRALKSVNTPMRQSGGDKRSKNTRGLLGWINS